MDPTTSLERGARRATAVGPRPSAGRRLRAALVHRVQTSILWHVKLRLQFTGWLQYMLPLVPAALLLVLAGLGRLAESDSVLLVRLPAFASGALLLAFAFDVITVKYGVRPAEPLPKRRDGLSPST